MSDDFLFSECWIPTPGATAVIDPNDEHRSRYPEEIADLLTTAA